MPTIFGMNFQAVSMGQKMAGNGYLDGEGTPSPGLLDALDHTDRAIGAKMHIKGAAIGSSANSAEDFPDWRSGWRYGEEFRTIWCNL